MLCSAVLADQRGASTAKDSSTVQTLKKLGNCYAQHGASTVHSASQEVTSGKLAPCVRDVDHGDTSP